MDECGAFPVISRAAAGGALETETTPNATTNVTLKGPDVEVDLFNGHEGGGDKDQALINAEDSPVENDAVDSDNDQIHAGVKAGVSHKSASGQGGLDRVSGKKGPRTKKKKSQLEAKEQTGSGLTRGAGQRGGNLATVKSERDEGGGDVESKGPVRASPPGSENDADQERSKPGELRPPLIKKKAAKRRAQRKKAAEAAKAAALVSGIPTEYVAKLPKAAGSAGEGKPAVASAKRKRGKYVARKPTEKRGDGGGGERGCSGADGNRSKNNRR